MKALLIVDMLADFIYPKGALYLGPPAEELIKGVRSRLEEYRADGDLVIYLCDRHPGDDQEFDMFPPHSLEGSKGSEIIAELAPRADERVIGKRRFSGFCGTDLDLTLREKGVTELELAGCVTNICILYTAADARMLNYRVSVSEKAVASFDEQAHSFALQEMEKTLGVTLI